MYNIQTYIISILGIIHDISYIYIYIYIFFLRTTYYIHNNIIYKLYTNIIQICDHILEPLGTFFKKGET